MVVDTILVIQERICIVLNMSGTDLSVLSIVTHLVFEKIIILILQLGTLRNREALSKWQNWNSDPGLRGCFSPLSSYCLSGRSKAVCGYFYSWLLLEWKT